MAEYIITGDTNEQGKEGQRLPVLIGASVVNGREWYTFAEMGSFPDRLMIRFPDLASAVAAAERITGPREVAEVTVTDLGGGEVRLSRTATPTTKTTKRTPYVETSATNPDAGGVR